jgi:GTP-binding nuclear protein Ran
MEEPQKFKVVLIGDGGVGKSTYIKKLCTGIFEKQYVATLGVEIHPIDIPRDEPARDLIFDVWDTAGQEKLGLLRESYYEGAHLGIIMFDLTSRITYKNVATWYRSLVHVCGEIPIVLIGNKADRNEIKCPSHMITFYRGRPNMAYFETSVKNNYNLNEPIMWLIE